MTREPGTARPPRPGHASRRTNDALRPQSDFSFLARYGSIISKAGVATIPSALFFYQGELGLKPEEVWFACAILSHKWTSDLPYPSLHRLARSTGVGLTSLRRYRAALERAQWAGRPFLQVIARQRPGGGNSSNAYDLSGLFAALEDLIMRDQHIWFRGPLIGDGPYVPAQGSYHSSPLADVGGVVDNSVDISDHGTAGDARGGAAGGTRAIAARGPRGGATRGGREGTSDGPNLPPHGAPHVEEDASGQDEGPDGNRPVQKHVLVNNRSDEETVSTPATDSKAVASTDGDTSGRGGEDTRTTTPDSDWIDTVIDDLTCALHDDPANAKRNRTQARRVWQESGFAEEKFVDRIGKAKRRASAAKVTKQSVDGSGLPNRMPYFFKVLRDITGVD